MLSVFIGWPEFEIGKFMAAISQTPRFKTKNDYWAMTDEKFCSAHLKSFSTLKVTFILYRLSSELQTGPTICH